MPNFTNEGKSRFKTHNEILENPAHGDELEQAYRENEIREAADKIAQKYNQTPQFFSAVALELARREIAKQDKERARQI